jgi:transcriptional regulator with PAS, ATPase and Fis domain
VLVYGETGTGKELFARAIHNASHRANKPFIPVNCGAIPLELVDSVLFGHKKGAFTGATSDRPGIFEQANGGTLFLDEFGELEPSVQVRLLRILQEGTYVPVGGTKEITADVRLITATHRNLMEAVSEGSFREDLFYRVAVGVLHLPPLREREGDMSLIADKLMQMMSESDDALKDKQISPEARNIILRHTWRGNVRELQSTLLRAALWSQEQTISAEDMRQALFQIPKKDSGILEHNVSEGIDIQDIMGSVAVEYIHQALDVSNHNKTRAAQLLGLKNYQTLNNWMEKYGIS